ncbi:MAG: SDR family oxidoreductase [Candidatus Omnitrophota bacterium]
MRLLIVGASGVLGIRLYNDALKKKINTMGTYCSHEMGGLFYLDVRDRKGIEKLFNFFEPETVVLAGGITDVDICEKKKKLAEDVNVRGTLNLAGKARERGSRMVYVSTDYVFDGERGPYGEKDKPNPINVYGRTKLEAEKIVSSFSRGNLVIRTSQLYGGDRLGNNFAIKIIHNMRDHKKVRAADDFYSTPTHVGSLSCMILRLIESGSRGIYNCSGADFIDRFQYVRDIADVFGLDRSLIERVKLTDLRLKARRPRVGGLKIDKVKKELRVKVDDYRKGLRALKKEIGI